MASDIIIGGTPHVERPYSDVPIRFTPGTLTGTYDATITTLPAGSVIIAAKMVVIRAQAGTTCAVDIEIGATGAGDTTLLAGGADWATTLGNTESANTDANLTTINAVSLGGSDLVVNAEITYGATATTAPIIEVILTVGRSDY